MYGNLPFEISLKDNEIYPPLEEARKLAKERTEQYYKINKIRYDKKFQEADFKVGDLVIHEQFNINLNLYTNAELTDIRFIYGLSSGNGRAAIRFCGGRYPTRRNRIIKLSLGCIRASRNMGLSELRLKVLGGCRQCEHPYLKRMCCMLWTKIPIAVYRSLPFQPEDLEQLAIVYCRAKPYIRFMHRECGYYNQMIARDVSRLHSGKVRQTCTLPVPCSVTKQAFHMKGFSKCTTCTSGP
ncbi:hypothetical protein TNCV_4815421 [Trichonephila clavipes]|nr:hypothetical protein TNCV_4815421 [Trichonephila clavipes]